MKKDSIIDFLGFIVAKLLIVLFFCIPLGVALWIGRRAGDLVYLVNSKRRAIGYANLKSAFPEKTQGQLRAILKSHFENLGMNVVELLKVPSMGKKYWDRHVRIENFDRIERALSENKGLIMVSAHFGNWEVSSLAVSFRGQRVSVFAREQKYPRLNNLLNKYREMTGCKVVTKGFSVRDIIKTLNNNGVVGMLVDQDAGPNGVFIDFLNRPASIASGIVNFGLKTGAVILPAFMHRRGYDRHVLEIKEPVRLITTGDKKKDVKVNLDKLTRVSEAYIKKFPEQWLWSHKRWKSTPQRSVLVLNDGKAGHFNQSMAVAEMFGEALGSRLKARGIDETPIVKVDALEVKFKNRFTRFFLDLVSIFATARCQGCLRCLRFCLKKESFEEIKSKYRDVIISCGASTVAANIFLKYENNAKGVVIMKPGLGRSGKFNLVVLPRHDAPRKLRPGMLVTETAPNRITEEAMKEALLGCRVKGVGCRSGRGIGLLIGGDAKNFILKREIVAQVVDGMSQVAGEMDLDIFVSTSRRTKAEIDSVLKDKLSKNSRCRLLVIANENNIDGIVPAIFGLVDLVIVSPESISMISEAVSSGKYVVVFISTGQTPRHQNKYEKAIENLKNQGYIKIAAPEDIYDVVKTLLKEKPPLKKLEDRKRIVERLQGII